MPVCIAGMHRSGTSLLTHMLHACGLDLGSLDELIPANPSNQDGHWEHTEFVRLNDELLDLYGAGWDLPPRIAPDWQDDNRLTRIRSSAASLISQFPTDRIWGWKDPRSSLTLPFWNRLLPNLKVVICVRNPLAVASSLRARGSSSYNFGLDLWQTYNERLLANSAKEQRLVVHYDSLFPGNRETLQRVTDFIGMRIDTEQLGNAYSVVKPNLRHHRFAIANLSEAKVSPTLVNLYCQLCDESAWTEI